MCESDSANSHSTYLQDKCQLTQQKTCINAVMVNGYEKAHDIINNIDIDINGKLRTTWLNHVYYFKEECPLEAVTNGTYGFLVKLIFENETKDQISILEKKSKFYNLEEITVLKNHSDVIKNTYYDIIPIKELDGRVFMLEGIGSLYSLSTKTKLDISTADYVITRLKHTLMYLKKHKLYYFDLKTENVVYHYENGKLCIWLVDLGSMLPRQTNGVPFYIASCPHPVINSRNIYYETSFSSSQVPVYLETKTLSIYAYQLSVLFFELIGITPWIPFTTIDTCDQGELMVKIQNILAQISHIQKNKLHPQNSFVISKYKTVYIQILYDLKRESQTEDSTDHDEFWV